MIRVPCEFEGPDHEYPDDWVFGGADGKHPGADPRWQPSSYTYYDGNAKVLHVTSVPLCDDEAIDKFTWVAGLGDSFNPVWVSATRYLEDGSRREDMLPWTYDKTTDMATERPK